MVRAFATPHNETCVDIRRFSIECLTCRCVFYCPPVHDNRYSRHTFPTLPYICTWRLIKLSSAPLAGNTFCQVFSKSFSASKRQFCSKKKVSSILDYTVTGDVPGTNTFSQNGNN
jgi:hypothetical protein